MSLDKFSAKGRLSLGRKIQKTAQNLIGHFDPKAKITVEDKDESWFLDIESEMASILIGRRGQNLQALEHLLRLILTKEADEFTSLNIDISGYRAAREQEISEMARDLAEKVIATGQEETLPPMNAFERRLVHLLLADIEGIVTESAGEEPYRRIIIRRIGK